MARAVARGGSPPVVGIKGRPLTSPVSRTDWATGVILGVFLPRTPRRHRWPCHGLHCPDCSTS
jgi:hypothetical protein